MPDNATSLGLRAGVWECSLRLAEPPRRVALTLHGQTLGPAEIAADGDGHWRVRARLPAETLTEGVQTYVLIADDGNGDEPPRPGARRLARLPLIAGEALESDLRAEISLMRDELDLLKRELRRLAAG